MLIMPRMNKTQLETARDWLQRNPNNEPRRLLDVWPGQDAATKRHVDRARRMVVTRTFVPDRAGVPEREVRYRLSDWAVHLAQSS